MNIGYKNNLNCRESRLMKYLITGGSGFIGRALIARLKQDNHDIIVLSRNPNNVIPDCRMIQTLSALDTSESIDVAINLAGSPIDKRWSTTIKQELIDSRVNTTSNLVKYCGQLAQAPSVMISASAIGYYGPQGQTQLNEQSAYIDSFTHEICQAWETTAQQITTLGTRLCITRLGVVLGKGGGMLKKVELPFRFGLGGHLGTGKQILSWIHLSDVIAGFLHLIEHAQCCGIYNLTAPNPVSNSEFTQCLARTLHRPALLPLPDIVIRRLFGEMGTELLLKGQYVVPQRLLQQQFVFAHSTLECALSNIFTS